MMLLFFMPTSKILELYTEIKKRVDTGSRFYVDTFKGQEYVASAPKLTVIDIGAWQGDYSYYCLPFADIIYAIEPDPVPYQILEDTVKQFGLQDKIKTFRLAINNRNGEVGMVFSHEGGSAFSKDGTLVECKTLATFIKENEIEKVDIIKIDVENAEYDIFKSEDFAEVSNRIKYIIGEVHRGLEELEKPLSKLGFTVRMVPGTNIFEAKK